MQIAPNFQNRSTNPARVSFQFAVSGTQQSGIVYVTQDRKGDDLMVQAAKAAKIAAKRAGAADAILHNIINPVR